MRHRDLHSMCIGLGIDEHEGQRKEEHTCFPTLRKRTDDVAVKLGQLSISRTHPGQSELINNDRMTTRRKRSFCFRFD